MQHDYFSSFNQSDHCFLGSSLPHPSLLLKLPISAGPTYIRFNNNDDDDNNSNINVKYLYSAFIT